MDTVVTANTGAFSWLDSLSGIWDAIMDKMPTFLAGLAILVVGWLIARFVRWLLRRVLKAAKFDALADRIHLNDMFNRFNLNIQFSEILVKFAYWVVMLLVIISAAETFGLTVVSEQIGSLIEYLPKLFVALLIFTLGLLGADFLKRTVSTTTKSIGVSGSRIIGNIVFYVLLVFVSITALNQAGVDTTLITSNITVILGSVLLAFAVAYGIAAREILTNILSSYYGKDRFREGQVIRIQQVEGEIIKIDSISVTVQAANKKVVIPCRKLVSEEVEILEDVEELE